MSLVKLASWEADIKKAQKQTTITKFGKQVQRIKFGDEADDWGGGSGKPCHDCNAVAGQYHIYGCDVERCPICGGQAIGCECDYRHDAKLRSHK